MPFFAPIILTAARIAAFTARHKNVGAHFWGISYAGGTTIGYHSNPLNWRKQNYNKRHFGSLNF